MRNCSNPLATSSLSECPLLLLSEGLFFLPHFQQYMLFIGCLGFKTTIDRKGKIIPQGHKDLIRLIFRVFIVMAAISFIII